MSQCALCIVAVFGVISDLPRKANFHVTGAILEVTEA
jgi:hypothetical protein